jgi:acyl-CoA synthetase (NDP forming)
MVLSEDEGSLETLFNPDSIALIGASGDPEKLSGRPNHFLKKFSYDGDVYLVNPKHDTIDGEPCYDSITQVPGEVDVAMVLVPSRVVPSVIAECGDHGVPYAIIIASGFSETGEEGNELETEIIKTAQENGLRLVGPNSEGLISLERGVAASFSSILKRDDLQTGNVGFVSQSGAFGGAVFQLMQNLGIGANKWITTGNEADLDALDVMDYYVEDPEIDVIATYLESVEQGRRLLDIGKRAVETDTDIVAMRVGKSEGGKRATESHTGSIGTDDEIYEAIMNQAGVTRVWSVDEFADTVSGFSRLPATEYPTPKEGLGVISMSGGAAALIADSCDRFGLSLANLSERTREAIRREIPSYGSASNPVDVTGAAISDPDVFENCVTAIADDDNVGMLLLQYGNSGDETIEVCKETILDIRKEYEIPIASVFTGSKPRETTVDELAEANVWTFGDPVRAIKTFGAISESATQTPPALPEEQNVREQAENATLSDDNWESAVERLSETGIAFAPSMTIRDEDEAATVANRIGYPVALKLDPLAISHKSEVGGVQIGLDDEAAVREAYRELDSVADEAEIIVQQMVDGVELIVGIVDDPDFGPVMMFGPGGVFVELFDDAFSYRALPVPESSAREMIRESSAARLLDGYRDVPAADVDTVASLLSAASEAYLKFGMSELELNPVIATSDDCLAVDLLVE